MRIARFVVTDSDPAEMSFGLVEGEPGEEEVELISGHPFTTFTSAGHRLPLSEVRLVAPYLPSKVVAIGKNYADHAREMGGEPPAAPIVFLKPSTSVVGPNEPVQLPPSSGQVEYEGELAVVIGRFCRDVPASRALDMVLGYTCGNDVTARDQQRTDGQWSRAKGYDTFCPLGPWIATDVDPTDAQLTTRVNGEVRQQASTGLMVHDVPELIAYVSSVMTLLPGDVLMIGTPAGVGGIVAGDVVEVTIDGIGTLRNPVVPRA